MPRKTFQSQNKKNIKKPKISFLPILHLLLLARSSNHTSIGTFQRSFHKGPAHSLQLRLILLGHLSADLVVPMLLSKFAYKEELFTLKSFAEKFDTLVCQNSLAETVR